MILKFIKEYTRPSGRVLPIGALGEFDQATSNTLIADGYAIPFAANTSEIGCVGMLTSSAHLTMGAHDLVKSIDPESIESNNKFK